MKKKHSGIIIVSLLSIIGIVIFMPLPSTLGVQPIVTAEPSEYTVAGKEGVIVAPNIATRQAYARDWLFAQVKADPVGADLDAAILGDKTAYYKELNTFIGGMFNIPDRFFQEFATDNDVHALMAALAKWNEQAEEDVTQGRRVMGIGTLAADGSIGMVDHVADYAKAGLADDPDVFFVPVEAYEQMEQIAPDLLIVPVSHFREILFFLAQPVPFWALSNYALFCH